MTESSPASNCFEDVQSLYAENDSRSGHTLRTCKADVHYAPAAFLLSQSPLYRFPGVPLSARAIVELSCEMKWFGETPPCVL